MKQTPRLLLALVGSAMLLSISSCGGGGSSSGGGGTVPGVATPAATVVSGTVTAPGGAVAFFKQPSLNDLFVSEAYAALTGLVTVDDSTTVQLARLDATGTNFTVLATTTTSGGRYSFNLTALGLQPSNDLIVRVAGSSTQMRAFVIGTVADLSPVSEAAFQLAIQSLGSGSLSNLTLQEVSDISGAVALIVTAQNIGTATAVNQAVALVKAAVGGNAQITSFIALAAGTGQTSSGPGDVGNFVPMEQSNTWRYQSSIIASGQPSRFFDHTQLVSGQVPDPVFNVNATVISDTNAEGENRTEKGYLVKSLTGVVSYGNDDLGDDLTRRIVPIKTIHFPLTVGTSIKLGEKSGIDWGDDIDGDNRSETFSVSILQNVIGFENVAVGAGNFPLGLRVEQKTTFSINLTNGGTLKVTETESSWFVSGVGLVKAVTEIETEDGLRIGFVTEDLVAYVVSGQGGGARIELGDGNLSPGSPLNLRLENTRQLFGGLYDQSNRLIPGVPFIFTSTNPNVVSVDAQGIATALSPGTATITARLGNTISNGVPITVNDVRVLSLPTKDLVYDPVSQRLYASIPSNAGSLANTITVIDPISGSVGPSLNVGIDPGKLAISDNGQYLYVGLDGENSIQRVTLSTFTAGPKFVLSGRLDPTCNTWTAGEIRVQPGNPLVVAVLKRHCGASEGVEIYDGGIKRADTVPLRLDGIAFSQSPGTLYGIEGGTFSHVYRMAVFSTGISVSATSPDFQEPFGVHIEFDSGRLFSTSAQVFDATTLNEIGRFQHQDLPHGGLITPNISSNRVYIIPNMGGLKILGFDATTFQLVGSIPILHNLDSGTFGFFEGSFIKWGINGLAFRTGSDPLFGGLGVGDRIVLIRTTAIS